MGIAYRVDSGQTDSSTCIASRKVAFLTFRAHAAFSVNYTHARLCHMWFQYSRNLLVRRDVYQGIAGSKGQNPLTKLVPKDGPTVAEPRNSGVPRPLGQNPLRYSILRKRRM